jgi:hypothetical protein
MAAAKKVDLRGGLPVRQIRKVEDYGYNPLETIWCCLNRSHNIAVRR